MDILKEYIYASKEDYDKQVKINGEQLKVYSKKKLNELYPDKNYIIHGETSERQKKDADSTIGKIALNRKWLYIAQSGKHNALIHKKSAFAEISGGGFVALIKLRLLPIILIIALLIGGITGGIVFALNKDNGGEIDPGIKPVVNEIITVSGTVYKAGEPVADAQLSLQSGNDEINKATTDKDGKYLLSDVKNGEYNLVCYYGDSILTKKASVNSKSVTVDFYFPADDLSDIDDIAETTTKEAQKPSTTEANTDGVTETTASANETTTKKADETTTKKADETTTKKADETTTKKAEETTTKKVEETTTQKTEESTTAKPVESTTESGEVKTDVKALVKIKGDNTPKIAVGGVDTEAIRNMVIGKTLQLTFFAEKLAEADVPETDRTAIEAIRGDLQTDYYDFSVLKELYIGTVRESSEYLKNTQTVFEIAVPHDSSKAVGTYVFRYHDDKATRLEELKTKPTENFTDGTYYVSASTVYIYTSSFSTYAVGSANVGQTVMGSDTITYSNTVTVNLKTKQIDMLYEHDENSTNSAKVQIYLVGENADLLISESGIIPVGNCIEKMTLKDDLTGMPSVGTYEGYMRIVYVNEESVQADTNVKIPVNVAVTQ